MASQRDALLVTEVTGRPLRTLDPHEIDDELLQRIWGNAGRLHALGVAHRRLDASRIVVRPDGTPAFGDFGGAEVAADDADIATHAAHADVVVAVTSPPGPVSTKSWSATWSDGRSTARTPCCMSGTPKVLCGGSRAPPRRPSSRG